MIDKKSGVAEVQEFQNRTVVFELYRRDGIDSPPSTQIFGLAEIVFDTRTSAISDDSNVSFRPPGRLSTNALFIWPSRSVELDHGQAFESGVENYARLQRSHAADLGRA